MFLMTVILRLKNGYYNIFVYKNDVLCIMDLRVTIIQTSDVKALLITLFKKSLTLWRNVLEQICPGKT
jgi:hypothetical protein